MTEQNSTNFNADDFTITSGAMELNDAVIKSVVSDSGTSTPSAHVLTVLGSNGLTTTATGSTITIAPSGVSTDYEYISSVTADDDAYVVFTNLSSDYFIYIILIYDLIPATDNTDLYMRTSTDNGSNYDSGASDYRWLRNLTATSLSKEHESADSKIKLLGDCGTASGEIAQARIEIYNPLNTYCTLYSFKGFQLSQEHKSQQSSGFGDRTSAADVDAIQFLMSSGNISSGIFKLYGITGS